WADEFFDWPFQSNDNNAPKVAILDRINGSANPGEIVVDNQHCFGFVHGYRRLTEAGNAFQGFERSRSTPANSSNFQWQCAIDNGGALSNQNSYEQRYGPFRYGMDPD